MLQILVTMGILALPPGCFLMLLFGMPTWRVICNVTGRDPDKIGIVPMWLLGVATFSVVCFALYMLGVRLPPISVDY